MLEDQLPGDRRRLVLQPPHCNNSGFSNGTSKEAPHPCPSPVYMYLPLSCHAAALIMQDMPAAVNNAAASSCTLRRGPSLPSLTQSWIMAGTTSAEWLTSSGTNVGVIVTHVN